MIKLVLLGLVLTVLSSVGGAWLATTMNRVDGVGTPVQAAGSPLTEQRTGALRNIPDTHENSVRISEENAQGRIGEGESASQVRRLLAALEQEHEMRAQAEERLATEQARQARRNTAPTPTAARTREWTSPRPEPAPPTAAAVPAARQVRAAVQEPATGTIAAGTKIQASVDKTISSDQAQPGDQVTATVRSTISDNANVLLRNGDQLIGTVTAVEKSGRMSGSERLTIGFHAVLVDGRRFELKTGSITRTGQSQVRQNTTRIGGGAAAGSILGAILGGSKGAAIGGAIGAASGTAAAAAQRGAPATLEAGETILVETTGTTTISASVRGREPATGT